MFINIDLFNIYCFISQKNMKNQVRLIFLLPKGIFLIRQEILKNLYIIRTVKIKQLTIK